MHSYLRSIGFSEIKKESELQMLLDKVFRDYDKRETAKIENGVYLEMRKDFLPGIGIALCGVMDEEGFHQKYYFPYYRCDGVSTFEEITIEQRADGHAYAGVVDDGRIGVSMIFYVQNNVEYMRENQFGFLKCGKKNGVVFTGLAGSGTILLPIAKNEKKENERRKTTVQRTGLINAAREGNEEAIESLTVEDMDLYSMITRRVQKEDIFSIVETSFMPYGIECDKYQIIGNINYYTKLKNPASGEEVYQMNVECNDMYFDICINAKDLLGDPDEGRRFKGTIWLQGKLNLE